jgi:hypothetical protein
MSAGSAQPSVIGRLLGAVPDALSCAMYLAVWIAPLAVGAEWVKNLMITMLLEFLSVHSGGIIGSVLANENTSRAKKSMAVAGFGLFYMLFAGGFSLVFSAWWPAAMFAWLLLAKFAVIWLAPQPGPLERQRQQFFIAFAVVGYLGGAFLTALLPIPELGIDAVARAAAEIPGSGLWVEEPHRVVAFGALYFGAMAWAKWRWRPGMGMATAARSRPD